MLSTLRKALLVQGDSLGRMTSRLQRESDEVTCLTLGAVAVETVFSRAYSQ
jgi:hypothetical protein